jgi:AraC family ethanolamine operon transcriptional activator
VEGRSSPDGYVLYLPLTEECAYSANGTVLGENSFMILEAGCDFCISTEFKHDWCSIFVPNQTLARGREPEASAVRSEKTKCRVISTSRRVVGRFWTLVSQTMAAAAQCPEFESSPAGTDAEAELFKVASFILGRRGAGAPDQSGRPRVSREEIIRRSKELMQKREGEPVHLGELTAAAEVSERTLRRAFNEYFGVGPVRYLQLRRLHQIQRALWAAEPEGVSVTNLLVRHGEWDFGRFARRYRQQFGELPSETLRSKIKVRT